jgi:hypothetical protein
MSEKKQTDKEGYDVLSVKISPDQSVLLNTICDVLGVNTYQIFQMFFYTLMRASAPLHELSPEIQKIMTFMETDASWAEAFNMANPNDLRVARTILILEQEDKKGFGAVMVTKPSLPGEKPMMTECVDDILECVTEATMIGIYNRLRRLGARLHCEHLSDILLTMIDAQSILLTEEENRFEMKGEAMYDQRGRKIEYGKKSKAKQHRTPDSVAQDQRIKFDEYDREVSDYEVQDWEGEYRHSDLQPPKSYGDLERQSKEDDTGYDRS